MFLRSQLRKQDGQEHPCWSVVENKRRPDGRVAQRQVLYLGAVNDSQRAAGRKTLDAHTPAADTTFYRPLVPVEEAFKNLKGDWRGRPVYPQKMGRIEAHLLVACLSDTLHVCLRQRLKLVAGGPTPRAVLEKFCAVQVK